MHQLQKLKVFDNARQGMLLIENYIKMKAESATVLQIMEAGCGRKWPIDLAGIQYVLTGVDRDEAALELRQNIRRDLHQAIVGDLLTVSVPQKFDIIYSAFVLEHIEEAERVLDIFNNWLKDKGLIVLWIPDPHSVRGFVTRITPQWFHVFCYKYILKIKNAGQKGYAPYPTHYASVVSRPGIHKFCADNQFSIKEEHGFSSRVYGKGLMGQILKSVAFLISLLSLGSLSYQHCNLLYILEKESNDPAS